MVDLPVDLRDRRRVGKGALAPCPPSVRSNPRDWWARCALPTLRSFDRHPASLRAQRSNPSILMLSYGLLRFARNDGWIATQCTIVIPAHAGIQYAAASRFNH